MTADKGPEEEYQYPEEEYVQTKPEPQMNDSTSTYTQRAKAGAGLMGKVQSLASNRIFVIVLVVVILFIVIRILTTRHKIEQKTAPHTETTAVAEPSTQTQEVAPVYSELSPSDQGELSDVRKMASNNQAAIQGVEQQLNTLQNSVVGLSQDQTQLNEAVAQLATEFKQLAVEVKQPKRVVKRSTPVAKPVVYYLRAVVPGRAWIYGSNGRSASITLGDQVKQYGKVLAINAEEGIVLTSSGKVIEFSSTDR